MTILTSIIAKTTVGAIIEIIILLLIAGTIAYLTAYAYYKSVYTKKINLLEEEKAALERRISVYQAEIDDLSKKIQEMEKKSSKT